MADGLLMVYTGNCPENYYSPLGQAFRSLGRGLRVCVIEFVNRKDGIGSLPLDKAFDGRLKYHSGGVEPGDEFSSIAAQQENATRFLHLAKEATESGQFEMVVLDRIADLIATGLIDSREVLEILSTRPPGLHIMLSGHSVPDELCQAADLVTRVEHVKPSSHHQDAANAT